MEGEDGYTADVAFLNKNIKCKMYFRYFTFSMFNVFWSHFGSYQIIKNTIQISVLKIDNV